jgi:tetratricopeptide (TPR) repeat protein
MTRWTTTLLAALAIVAVVAAAYSNSFTGPFIFDDIPAIQKNTTIRSLRSAEVLVPPGNVTVARRPLTNLSFAVSYAIGRLTVRSYHAVNLLIHLLAALALFGILRRTLVLPALRDRFGDASTGLAAAAALVWALHPLQTESVTYIVQRAESLMGLCYLLTLYALIRGASSNRPRPWYAASVVACALGMGAKEVMATAPVVVLLYDRVFLSGSFREALRRRGPLYLGLAATWAALGAMMFLYKAPGGAGFGISTVTPWRYALTQAGVILHYLGLSFWPSSLCLDYSWPIAQSAWQDLPAAAVIAALLAGTFWALRRAPMLGFFGAWFFLILAPSSSFFPIVPEVAAEHRMYLPLAALAAAAVIAAYLAAERWLCRPGESQESRKRLALGMAALLALCGAMELGVMTIRRNTQYRTEISIWEDASHKRPENPRAWNALGEAYVNAGRYDEAIRVCKKALVLKPKFPPAYCTRGLAYAGMDRLREAIQDYDKAIALSPDFTEAYSSRAAAYAKSGRLTEAIRDYDKAIAFDPDFAEAYNNRGVAYAQAGRSDEAMSDYDEAIKLYPDFAKAYSNRGNALANANHVSEAIGDYDKAIAFDPRFAEAYNNRGVAYTRSDRLAEALRDFDKAIALQPDYAAAYNNRAVANYAMTAYEKAWADVKMFIRLGGRPDPGFLKALGQAAGPAERP